MKKTLVIFAHPNLEQSKLNKKLLEALNGLSHVTLRDVYAKYGSDPKNIDVKNEQELLLAHERIIFQFPFYWYSTPGLLKDWQDRVLEYGFAYGSTGDKLSGKEFKCIVSVGGADYAYQAGGWNNYTMSELLRPLQQMANLTKMLYTAPLCVHGAVLITNEELELKTSEYREILTSEDWGGGLAKYLKKMEEKGVKL